MAEISLGSGSHHHWHRGLGSDHQSIKAFERNLTGEIARLWEELCAGTYRPRPIWRVYINKPGSREERPLGIPCGRVIELINPILRGWVNYFRVGHSSRCFAYVKDWVEKKIRRHLMRARKRKGLGWNRWSRGWMYQSLGLYSDYGVRYFQS